jgi:hypothetical protein
MTTSPTKALHDLGVSELAAGLRAKQFLPPKPPSISWPAPRCTSTWAHLWP